MSELIARFCPQCGTALTKGYCRIRQCPNFGRQINVLMEQREVKVTTPTEDPLIVSDRQLTALVDGMTKDEPTDFYGDLQRVSKRQVDNLAEALNCLCAIEKGFRNMPMTSTQRDQMLSNLNRVASWLQSKADYACKVNNLSTEVVLSDYRRLEALETACGEAKKVNACLKAEKAQLEAALEQVNKA